MTCLDNQLVIHWGGGEVPLLSIQDGILGHEVPAFQQQSLLELVMSVDYIGTSQSMAWSWAATHPARADCVRLSLNCQGSSGGSVFSLSGNVHPWAVTRWDLVDHFCSMVKWCLVFQVH